jgi:putative addiction module component (TIGR02574 family)
MREESLMNLDEHLADIVRLPIDLRIELVKAILDSITADMEPPELTEAQKQELDRRLAYDEANPDDGITWEQIQADLRAKRGRSE